jgi:hypothetical protein
MADEFNPAKDCSLCGEDTSVLDQWKLTVEGPLHTFEIYDEGRARIIAVFYEKADADAYVAWRNENENRWRGVTANER